MTTLAVALGGVIAVFSVAYGILLRPLPIHQPAEVLAVYESRPEAGQFRIEASGVRFDHWNKLNRVFTGMVAASDHTFDFMLDGAAVRVSGELVSSNFFELLGAVPLHGRFFTSKDELEGSLSVPSVIAERLWRRNFGADPTVLGRSLLAGDVSLTIVGVVPDAFERWRQPAGIWVPYRLTPTLLTPEVLAGDGYHVFQVLGRLRPGVSADSAAVAMVDANRQATQNVGRDIDPRWGVATVPVRDLVSTPAIKRSIWLLSAVTVVVLMLAAANVASLMLTRVIARGREFATRLALGAGLARLTRQLVLESALLAAAGGALGVLLAWWAMPILIALAPANATSSSVIAIDLPVLACGAAATLVALLAAVALPVLRVRRADVLGGLRFGGVTVSPPSTGWAHPLLVVAQAIVATPVVAAAALLLTTVVNLVQIDPGFDARQLVTMRVSLPSSEYADEAAVSRFHGTLLERLASIPGIETGALSNGLPVSWFGDRSSVAAGVSIEIEGGKRYLNGEMTDVPFTPGRQRVTSGYFRTVGIRLLTGRDLAVSDGPGAPLVAVVNEAMARVHWPGENPVGKRVRFDFPSRRQVGDPPWVEIVGVVSDARHYRLDAPGRPQVYTAFSQGRPAWTAFIHVRSALPADPLAHALRDVVRSLGPRVPLDDVRSVDAIMAELTATPRYSAALVTLLGAIALLLAAVGVYGLGAFAVSQRTREIGIRMALGASRTSVTRRTLISVLVPGLVGLLIGAGVAAMTMSQLRGLLYGIEPSNPLVFGAAMLILLLAAAVAAYLPARRAARTDPLVALRTE